MAAWDELVALIRRIEEEALRLQLDESAAGWQVMREAQTGWYSRPYLADRLPSEIARSSRSGRPFGLGLLDTGGEPLVPARWRGFIAGSLDPAEVAVLYSEQALCFLFPERDGPGSARRIFELADKAVVWGLVPGHSLKIAALSFPEHQGSPGLLLSRLEERLEPWSELALHRGAGKPASGGRAAIGLDASAPELPVAGGLATGSGHAGERVPSLAGAPKTSVNGVASVVSSPAQGIKESASGSRTDARSMEPANGKAHDREAVRAEARTAGPVAAHAASAKRVPVAVGFAAERTLPVSFWFRGELHTIDAVMDEEEGDGRYCLKVLTRAGLFCLERAGGRWFAEKLEDR